MDSAVNAVFAALIMHSQECREELATFGKGSSVYKHTAESCTYVVLCVCLCLSVCFNITVVNTV